MRSRDHSEVPGFFDTMRSAVRRLFLVFAAFLLLSSFSTKANDDDDDFSEFDDEIEVEIDEEQSADEQSTKNGFYSAT